MNGMRLIQSQQTPDSLLRLRCSSTQAQILMAETATALILPVAALNNQQNTVSRSTGESAQGQGWQQRRLQSYNTRKRLQIPAGGQVRSNAFSAPSSSGARPTLAASTTLAGLSALLGQLTWWCSLSHQSSIKWNSI